MNDDPRISMTVLPASLQPFLTWLTGMPLPGEQPRFLTTAWRHAAAATGLLVLGLAIGMLSFRIPVGWLAILLPPALILITSGMRYHYAVIEHYCIHNAFLSSRWANRLVAEIISTALLAAPYDLYRRDHLKHHATTRTNDDPDVVFLTAMGFRRGMQRPEFRRYMARTLISPIYHMRYMRGRLLSNLRAPAYRVLMTLGYVAATVWCLLVTGWWLPWLVLWVLPATVLFQASSLINYHSEHPWLLRPGMKGRIAVAAVTVGRFCGDPVPDAALRGRPRMRSWAIWWLRLVAVHLPYRLFVLVGDQSQHDLHHRRPGSNWTVAAYRRRDDVAAGSPGWPVGYRDVWGTVLDHLDACVDGGAGRRSAPTSQLALTPD